MLDILDQNLLRQIQRESNSKRVMMCLSQVILKAWLRHYLSVSFVVDTIIKGYIRSAISLGSSPASACSSYVILTRSFEEYSLSFLIHTTEINVQLTLGTVRAESHGKCTA